MSSRRNVPTIAVPPGAMYSGLRRAWARAPRARVAFASASRQRGTCGTTCTPTRRSHTLSAFDAPCHTQ